MRSKITAFTFSVMALLSACRNDKGASGESAVWVSPQSGKTISLGDTVNLQVKLGGPADSVVYYANGERLENSDASRGVTVSTEKLSLGMKALTARIYRKGAEPEEISTTIVVNSSLVPQKYSYIVEKEFRHDTESYTQGLEYLNGVFYESDGLVGESSVRKVDPASGKVLQVTNIPNVFAEGITIIGDKILMITYTENLMMEYDLKTLQLLREFPTPYQRQGWGLCNDGKRIYNSDGSNTIYILNKDTYMQEDYIEVYDNNGPVSSLNELEFIDGKIFANVYESNRIVMIDPATGQVTGEVDLSDLYPDPARETDLVLNGIAWDSANRRLFVTGKKWDKLFQIRLSPQKAL